MKNILSLSLAAILTFCSTSVGAEEWIEQKETHFIIYYKAAPKEFVNTVAEMSEQYYEEIVRDLGFRRYKGWTWDERATIYIYDDQEDYIESGKRASWSHGVASPKDRVIRTFPTSSGFFDSTLPHELTHIVFREIVGFKVKIPAWFEEGVAMYEEKAKRFGANAAVKKAIEEGKFMTLEEMTFVGLSARMDKETIILYYAESASIVYFMVTELGRQRFINFCRKLKKGDPFEWAFESVYPQYKTLKRLNKAWLDYLQS